MFQNERLKRFLFASLATAGVLICLSWLANALTANLLQQAVPGVQFRHVKLDPLGKMLHIYDGRYTSSGVSIEVSRLDIGVDLLSVLGGNFNLSALTIERPFISIAIDKPWTSSQKITLPSLREVRINHGNLLFMREGKPLMKPVQVNLAGKRNTESRRPWQMQGSLNLAGGMVRVEGSMGAGGATFNLTATGVPVSELLSRQGHAGVTTLQGKASAELQIKAAFLSPMLTVAGRVHGKEIVVRLAGQPERQKIGTVYIEGRANLLKDIWKIHSVEVHDSRLHLRHSRQAAQRQGKLPRQLSIEKLTAYNAAITLLRPSRVGLIKLPLRQVKLQAHHIKGQNLIPKMLSINGLLPGGAFTVRLGNGKITGRLNGLDMKYLDRLSLTTTSHRIYFGKADAKLTGAIRQRHLDATVNFDIDGLVIGPRIPVHGVDGSIPLRAVAASLTGIDGHTRFPVRVSGDIASPVFSASSAVHQAVGSAALRSLGLPISILLSALSDDMRVMHKAIGFRNTRVRYSSDGRRTIRQLVRALRQDPELRLELRGCAYPINDGKNISKDALRKLATKRARFVRMGLIHQGISPARVKIVYPRLWMPSPAMSGLGPRVEASLLSS